MSLRCSIQTREMREGRTTPTASIHYGEASVFMENFLRTHTFRLLERAAEALAEEMLLGIPLLEKVSLEIKKPWAPIGLPLEDR